MMSFGMTRCILVLRTRWHKTTRTSNVETMTTAATVAAAAAAAGSWYDTSVRRDRDNDSRHNAVNRSFTNAEYLVRIVHQCLAEVTTPLLQEKSQWKVCGSRLPSKELGIVPDKFLIPVQNIAFWSRFHISALKIFLAFRRKSKSLNKQRMIKQNNIGCFCMIGSPARCRKVALYTHAFRKL